MLGYPWCVVCDALSVVCRMCRDLLSVVCFPWCVVCGASSGRCWWRRVVVGVLLVVLKCDVCGALFVLSVLPVV